MPPGQELARCLGLHFGPIAVNVSATEFRSRTFLDGVRAVLAETGVPPSAIELELTESVLMQDATSSQATLRAQGTGHRAQRGRFRHRLFEPQLSQTISDRCAQDRPILRAGP
ncbi:hypothetical protein LP419_35235 [Massilia sp. H-1]|nr:hypothetical protein LP419_35235 [Massilia sp. H-1]